MILWRPPTGDPVSSSKLGSTFGSIENSFSTITGKGVYLGLALTDGGGLLLNISGGTACFSGGATPYAGGSTVLANNITNHIYLTSQFNNSTRFFDAVLVTNVTGTDPSDSIKLGTVITSGGAIVTITPNPLLHMMTVREITNFIDNLILTSAGTVTSVGLTVPTGFAVTNSPITSSGNISFTVTPTGLLKGDGTGILSAVSGTDYVAPGSLGAAAYMPTGNLSGQIPVVNSSNKLDSSIIPVIEITNVFPVANQAAMLALTGASTGDIAVDASQNKSFILAYPPASTLSNWIEILAPGQVLSVAGRVGAVTLTTADVSGLNYGAYMPTGNLIGQLPVLETGNLLNISTIPVITTVKGGTGFSSYTRGDTLYADTTTSLAKLPAAVAGNAVLTSFNNGSYIEPKWQSTLSVAAGGTGLSTIGTGELLVGSSGTTLVPVTASSSTGQILTSAFNGTWYYPVWTNAPSQFTWVTITADTIAAINTGYIINDTALVTLTLPGTAAVGSVVKVTGKGTGGWKVGQPAGLTIYFGFSTSTAGTGGSLASTHLRNSIELVCITPNTEWNVVSSVGNITIV